MAKEKLIIPGAKQTKSRLTRYQVQKQTKSVLVSVFRYALLISVGYIILYPLFALIAYSIMSRADLLDPSVVWISKTPSFNNFKNAWVGLDYLTGLSRTIIVGVVSAFIEVLSCAIAAYGFARFKFKGNGFLFALVLFTAIVPVQVIAIPLYLNFRYFDFFGLTELIGGIFGNPEFVFDLTNTPLTFYLPSIFGVGLRSGLFIFIYRQFFLGLPKELEEAAYIDGAGPLKTFLRVIIPSSGVVIVTVSIFSVIWHWNEYFLSVLYFNDNLPLSVSLTQINSRLSALGVTFETQQGNMAAACLLFMLPMLIMYIFMQRKFIQSVDRVGIVG